MPSLRLPTPSVSVPAPLAILRPRRESIREKPQPFARRRSSTLPHRAMPRLPSRFAPDRDVARRRSIPPRRGTDPGVAAIAHFPFLLPLPSSHKSQYLANFHSRLTVSAETLSTSAVYF